MSLLVSIHQVTRQYAALVCAVMLSFVGVNKVWAQESYSESQSEPQQSNVSPPQEDKNKQNSLKSNTETQAGEQNESTSKVVIKPPHPIEHWHNSDLSFYEKAEQIMPMLAGTQDFIAIQQPQQTGNPKGIVIIVPDWQQHLANPKAMSQLRQQFPANGWHLIGIQPPNKPADFPRISGLPEDNIANEADLKNYTQALTERINIAIENAQNFPGVILVVAEGINAALFSQVFLEEANKKPSAFVSLSAYNISGDASQKMANALSKTQFPVLDLYLDKDSHWVQHASHMRKQAAQKNLKALYRQRMIYGQNHHYPAPELSRQIFNWLASLGW